MLQKIHQWTEPSGVVVQLRLHLPLATYLALEQRVVCEDDQRWWPVSDDTLEAINRLYPAIIKELVAEQCVLRKKFTCHNKER